MGRWLLVFAVFLVGCQVPAAEHVGCQESKITDSGCALAEENNVDLFSTLDSLEVSAELVSYGEDVGYLAFPEEKGSYPGVVMIHEWWGLNENIKDMARLLANEGFVVLAVDLYGGRVATSSGDARTYTAEVGANQNKANANMRSAAEYLRREQGATSIGSLGWCFGGGQSLQLALSGEELGATVIYYGHLVDDPGALSAIEWPVLGIFGEEDTSITVASVHSFEAALNALKIENDINIYPGVGHAFANPSGSRYAAAETVDAWEKTVQFLTENLNEGTA